MFGHPKHATFILFINTFINQEIIYWSITYMVILTIVFFSVYIYIKKSFQIVHRSLRFNCPLECILEEYILAIF